MSHEVRRPARWRRVVSPALAVGILATVGIAGSAAPANPPPAPSPHGRLVRMWMDAPSLGDPHRSVRVYLPRSYDLPEGAGRRYPVLYLLHGWPGTDSDWSHKGQAVATLDSLIARGRIPEVIAVMPNGWGIGLFGRSRYVNSWNGRSRMEDFIVRDVVGWVDRAYRTRSEPRMRGLIGLSEGADAAVNLAFKHPDVFGACGSHSGNFRLTRALGEGPILGPDSSAARVMRENSPIDYVDGIVERLRGLTIYLDCGVDDGAIVINREFDRRLTALGVPHLYHEYPGKHRWSYWRVHLPQSLVAVTAGMR